MRSLSFSGFLRWTVFLGLLAWVGLNMYSDIPLADLKARYTFPDSRFVTVEGMEVHYRRCGKGEPILLLHDANSSLHTWSGWIDSLSADYEVIALDLPGFGLTAPIRGGVTVRLCTSISWSNLPKRLNCRASIWRATDWAPKSLGFTRRSILIGCGD